MVKNKKYIIIAAILVVILCLVMVMIPYFYSKNEYSKYNLWGKKIIKMEYVLYEDEPFRSVIKEKKVIKQTSKNKELLKSFSIKLENAEIVAYGNKEATNEVLFIYFADKSKLCTYLDKDKLGIDYGNIWIKSKELSDILRHMEKVEIVDNIKVKKK